MNTLILSFLEDVFVTQFNKTLFQHLKSVYNGGELEISAMNEFYNPKEFAYILEMGTYNIYLGTDVRSASLCCEFDQETNRIVKRHKQACAPAEKFDRIKFINGAVQKVPVTTAKYNLRQIILDNVPETLLQTCDRGYKLADVKNGTITKEELFEKLHK